MVKNWIGIPSMRPIEWSDDLTLAAWWTKLLKDAMKNRKTMATIVMLVSWTIWKEWNARVLNNKTAPPTVLLEIIKAEAKLWVAAGTRCLSFVIAGV
jgi:hypothetical protein